MTIDRGSHDSPTHGGALPTAARAGDSVPSLGADDPLAGLREGLAPDIPDVVREARRDRSRQALFGGSVGRSFGRYIVLGELGRGGMGTVLTAYDPQLDRKVALKLLHDPNAERHAVRLEREAKALAKLSHPNVVQVYEVGREGDQRFVAMEWVPGITLHQWQSERRPWRACVEVYRQAGRGLAAAHAKGLVHRDFKPANCILDEEGRVRVLDFGLARGSGESALDAVTQQAMAGSRTADPSPSERTRTGTVLGTPAYMPPEQLEGREADARSDQFSFCVSLFEAVYGERPFGEGSVEHRVAAVIDGTLGGTEAGAPPRLRRVLARGLAAQPEERWPSMDALLEQLGRLVAPRARRWAWLSLGVGVLGVGGGLALGQLAMQRERCGDPLLRLTNIWDDGRRQEVKAAILGTELSFAPGTWQRVERRLDDYASAWASKHGEVCEASTEDAQGGADRRLRLDCIHERSRALRAAVDIMARADAEVVKNAVELVTDLPGLDRCDDLVALRALVPPPEDADARQRVEAIREVLADISAQEKVGRYAAALEDVEPVVERAEVLGYGPLVAETKALRGLLRDGDGRYADAEQDLLDAFETAMAHRHDEVAMQTARQLAFVIGYRQARHAEGGQWSRVARALAKRNGSDAELAGSLQGLGVLLYHQGHHEQAQRHHEQALRMTERIRGPRHPQVARILNNLAVALDARGEHEQAQLHYERALRIWEEVLGAGHPISGGILTNLGVALYAQKKYEQARLAHERAVQLRAEALGTDHPSVALSLTNLGFVLQAQDDHQQARVELGRALRIMETSLDAEHPNLAYPLCGLAKSALAQDDFESARTYAERAVAIRESSGVAPELLAEARMFLARVLWYYPAQRPRARALAEQAREVWVAGDRGLDDQRAEVEDWLANHPL